MITMDRTLQDNGWEEEGGLTEVLDKDKTNQVMVQINHGATNCW